MYTNCCSVYRHWCIPTVDQYTVIDMYHLWTSIPWWICTTYWPVYRNWYIYQTVDIYRCAGGAQNLVPGNSYYDTQALYTHLATEAFANGDIFPIHFTCLGFEAASINFSQNYTILGTPTNDFVFKTRWTHFWTLQSPKKWVFGATWRIFLLEQKTLTPTEQQRCVFLQCVGLLDFNRVITALFPSTNNTAQRCCCRQN